MADPLNLDQPIEDMAARLGDLYAKVSISRDPMFSWLHITNDATILGEELRRDREVEAAERAGKILIRLLEFLGYYLYCHADGQDELSNLVAKIIRAPSFDGFDLKGPAEGPSRWILFKYPDSCSKCGQRPCHCMVYPEVLENRREDPQEYLRMFKDKADDARKKLQGTDRKPFTLRTLLSFFGGIYRNSYRYQDPWKIGMHLYEEIGEATTELSRMNLQLRADKEKFDIQGALTKTFEIAKAKLEREAAKIADSAVRKERQEQIEKNLAHLTAQLKNDPWREFGRLVGDKFKEEVSDVFSWLSAVIDKLDSNSKGLEALLKTLSIEGMGGVSVLACKYCRKPICDNTCLVTHGISAEITEKLSKF